MITNLFNHLFSEVTCAVKFILLMLVSLSIKNLKVKIQCLTELATNGHFKEDLNLQMSKLLIGLIPGDLKSQFWQ